MRAVNHDRLLLLSSVRTFLHNAASLRAKQACKIDTVASLCLVLSLLLCRASQQYVSRGLTSAAKRYFSPREIFCIRPIGPAKRPRFALAAGANDAPCVMYIELQTRRDTQRNLGGEKTRFQIVRRRN